MTLIDKSLAIAVVRQALVDAAHTHGSTMTKASSAMFKAEMYATNAIAALPARGVGVKPLVDAVEALNAACDAMWNDHHRLELNPSLFGQEMRIKKKHVKAITEAQQRLPAILAALSPALAPTDAADELASVAAQIMADQKTMDLGVTEAQWQGLYETDPAPTDAAHVNETPKSEHDASNVLTAAQAREAALRDALSAIDALPEYSSPDVNIGVGNAYSAVYALLSEDRT